MKIKIFVENEAGSDTKNIYDEKTLKFLKSVTVSRKYPYPYGFILNTTADDGDNLDCFIITQKKLKSGQIVEANPIGLMEQMETSWNKSRVDVMEEDHNVLATLLGESFVVDDETQSKFKEFASHVFDHLTGHKVFTGNFLDATAAMDYIKKTRRLKNRLDNAI